MGDNHKNIVSKGKNVPATHSPPWVSVGMAEHQGGISLIMPPLEAKTRVIDAYVVLLFVLTDIAAFCTAL